MSPPTRENENEGAPPAPSRRAGERRKGSRPTVPGRHSSPECISDAGDPISSTFAVDCYLGDVLTVDVLLANDLAAHV